jgi:hypothetical protein
VPPKLAARVRLLATGNINKNDPNDARSVAVAALRSAGVREARRDDHAAVLKLWSKRVPGPGPGPHPAWMPSGPVRGTVASRCHAPQPPARAAIMKLVRAATGTPGYRGDDHQDDAHGDRDVSADVMVDLPVRDVAGKERGQ